MPRILSILSPASDAMATHEDIAGKGGYVVIDTNSGSSINDLIPKNRRKVGMVVYDIHQLKHYRCAGTLEGTETDDNWPEESDFGVSSLENLSDVNITNLSNDDILIYQNGQWINTPIPDFSGTDGGGATSTAKFLTWGTNLGLTNERVLKVGNGLTQTIQGTDDGDFTISLADTVVVLASTPSTDGSIPVWDNSTQTWNASNIINGGNSTSF
jgi:hypothetical protein